MLYINKYDVGNIQLDLPSPNYYHFLPLLSFSDIHGSLNLSIVFNYGMYKENYNFYTYINNNCYNYWCNYYKKTK